MLPDYLVKLIEEIAKNEQFTEFKIESKAGSSHGDNFLGIMTAVTLSGTRNKNGTIQADELHLLCKSPPTNAIRQKNFETAAVFEREIYIYSKLLPAFERFQREKGLSMADSFVSYPKVFACEADKATGTYILIMEDVRPKNFEMYPREQPIDLDHQLFVMRELGKFHAVSFAMKDQRPDEFNEFKQVKDLLVGTLFKTTIKSFVKKTIERAINALERPEHKQIMQHFLKTYIQRIDHIKNDEHCDEFGVITHGDCWINNFLFQYSNDAVSVKFEIWLLRFNIFDWENFRSLLLQPKQLKAICLVDWQLTHYCPPVFDLLYNIFSSTDKEFRDRHYEHLLKAYHQSLSDTIRRLGSDPKQYTYEDLQKQMQKYSDFALTLAPMIISIRVARAKDVSNLDDYAQLLEQGVEADVLGQFDEDTQKEYSRQINGLLTDLVNYGYVKTI